MPRRPAANQERRVDLLNVDAAVFGPKARACSIRRRGFFGIGIGGWSIGIFIGYSSLRSRSADLSRWSRDSRRRTFPAAAGIGVPMAGPMLLVLKPAFHPHRPS